jgi:hypothetical protein
LNPPAIAPLWALRGDFCLNIGSTDSGFIAMKSSLLSRKMWTAVFAIVLMLGVTVMPLSAEAGVKVRDLQVYNDPAMMQGAPDDDPTVTTAASGRLVCNSKLASKSLVNNLALVTGGSIGELRSIMKSTYNNRMEGYSMYIRNPPDQDLRITGGNQIVLAYDSRLKYRIKNTSALPNQPRDKGGQSYVGLISYFRRPKTWNFQFEGGLLYDKDQGAMPIQSGSQTSFPFSCTF